MEAADGAEALGLFDGRPVDLLITDFNMPNLNGAELIQKVRNIIGYKFIPILLLTTEVRQEKIQQAIDGNITWNEALYGYRFNAQNQRNNSNSARYTMLSVVANPYRASWSSRTSRCVCSLTVSLPASSPAIVVVDVPTR